MRSITPQQTAGNDGKDQLHGYLKALHLATIREGFEEAARQAVQESLGDDSYLLNLVEKGCEARGQRRIERLWRQSELPLEKTLATFELSRLSPQVVQQVNLVKPVIQNEECSPTPVEPENTRHLFSDEAYLCQRH